MTDTGPATTDADEPLPEVTTSQHVDDDPAAPGSSPPPDEGEWSVWGLSSTRLAFWVFVVYLAVALPILLWIGSYRWFFGDEWSFLSDRSITIDGLFRDHNQHWATLPVLAFRGLYSLFGVRTYVPYQLLVIVLHLALAALIRVVMRRAGVGPWVSTVAAGSFVLLGPAEDNILWAFQIGFVGSLLLGTTQVLLADHDGPIDRRDWIGVIFGAAALMTHGPAVALVFAAGVVCVLHRRWAAAALHTLPLGVMFVVWRWAADVQTIVGVEEAEFTAGVYAGWMWDAAVGLFRGLGNLTPVALLLALVLPVGLVIAWRSGGATTFLRRNASPIALFAAAILFMSLAAPGRFFLGTEQAAASRYVGVMAALTLPILAVAIDAIVRRWQVGWIVVAALLVAVPLNATEFDRSPLFAKGYFDAQRNYIASLPELPQATQVPAWVMPNDTIWGQPDMTIGWLLGARDEGKLPPTGEIDPATRKRAVLALTVAPIEADPLEGHECVTQSNPLGLNPSLGERWTLETKAQVAFRSGLVASSPWMTLERGTYQITLPDAKLIVAPVPGEQEMELCR